MALAFDVFEMLASSAASSARARQRPVRNAVLRQEINTMRKEIAALREKLRDLSSAQRKCDSK
jgi:uncharacterized protein involved in exopolysaccharide biosynthesis